MIQIKKVRYARGKPTRFRLADIPDIVAELLDVLARKFAREAEELAHVAVFVTELAEIVFPKRRLRVVADDPDNRILECAVAGYAGAVVTGDKGLLAVRTYGNIRIVTLRECVQIGSGHFRGR